MGKQKALPALSVDDAHVILGAVIARALSDVTYGTPAEQYDAVTFLDHIMPAWRTRRPAQLPRRPAPTRAPERE